MRSNLNEQQVNNDDTLTNGQAKLIGEIVNQSLRDLFYAENIQVYSSALYFFNSSRLFQLTGLDFDYLKRHYCELHGIDEQKQTEKLMKKFELQRLRKEQQDRANEAVKVVMSFIRTTYIRNNISPMKVKINKTLLFDTLIHSDKLCNSCKHKNKCKKEKTRCHNFVDLYERVCAIISDKEKLKKIRVKLQKGKEKLEKEKENGTTKQN